MIRSNSISAISMTRVVTRCCLPLLLAFAMLLTVSLVNQAQVVFSESAVAAPAPAEDVRPVEVAPSLLGFTNKNAASISIAGPQYASLGQQVTYQIDYEDVQQTGGVGYQIAGIAWANFQIVSANPAANSMGNRLIWPFTTIGSSGTALITGIHNQCGEVTHEATVLDTHDPATGSLSDSVTTIVTCPVNSVAISGPTTGETGSSYTLTAAVSPLTATEPITYVWQAAGQSPITSVGGISNSQTFSFSVRGPKTITVSAANREGIVSDSHLITLEEVPPTEITISGPEIGSLGTSYRFVANAGRSDSSRPLTYTWQATGQAPVIHTADALVDHVQFSWTTEGPHTISVSAANHGGAVTDTHVITVVRPLLTLAMSDEPDPVTVADEVTYLLTVTNHALVAAEEVTLFDELPSEAGFVSASASQGSCNEESGDVTCQLGTLISNQSVSMSFVVTATTNGRITNRAKVSTSNPDIEVETMAEDTLVTKPGLAVTKVSPDYGFNDVPTLIYIEGFGFSEPLTVNATTTDPDTGASESTPLDVRYVDPVLIIANVPAGLDPGFIDLTVTTTSDTADATNAYEAKDAALLDDLHALPEWFATNPLPMRVGAPDSGISLTVQHLGGTEATDNITVEFRLDAIDGALLGRSQVITPVAPFAQEATEAVSWEPTSDGKYTVFAIIDPDNQIKESDEENNVISRTIQVLPDSSDTEPPVLSEFLIADKAQTTFDQEVTLDVAATDFPKADGSGIQAIKFIEFEYILGARRWVPIQRSDWVSYDFAQANYPWRLIPTYGMRYMQAWGVDKERNISLEPSAQVIDLLPTEQTGYVAEKGVVFYRFYLKQGDTFATTLTPISGDPDLHVWDATGQRWSSSNNTGVERVEFEAPFTATYQIEVHGFTNTDYKLTFGATSNQPRAPRPTQGDDPKVPPEKSAVPLNNWPEYIEVDPPEIPEIDQPMYTLYLPLTMR